MVTFAPQPHAKWRSSRSGSEYGAGDTRESTISRLHPTQTGGVKPSPGFAEGIHLIVRSGSVTCGVFFIERVLQCAVPESVATLVPAKYTCFATRTARGDVT